ncbi:MAG: MFS transporter [Ornithinimicrobium sp.]
MAALTIRQRAVLVAASLAVGVAFLDETAVVTALRRIQQDLGMSSPTLHWVMGAYLLALASLMAVAGRLADLYGRQRVLIIGTVIFGLGSIACALAPSTVVLIVARWVQGAGAALMVPLGYAMATLSVPEQRRGWALGVVSTGATVMLAAGPVIGGGLTQLFGWRSVFAVNVLPVALILTVAIVTRQPRQSGHPSTDPTAPETPTHGAGPPAGGASSLDVPGLVLLVTGLAASTVALLQVQVSPPAVTAAAVVVGVVALGLFVRVERRSAMPLVDLSLLRVPAVASSLTALLAIQFAILGLTLYLTLYLQHVVGLGPALAGAVSLPAVLVAPFLATRVGRLADRRGTQAMVFGSLLLAAAAIAVIAALAGARAVIPLLVPLLAFGIARPVATVAATAGAVGAIPAHSRGLATALATQSRQIGAVLGVAVIGLVVTAAEHAERTKLLQSINTGFDSTDRAALDSLLADGNRSDAVLASLPPEQHQAVLNAASAAYVHGFEIGMIVNALVVLAAALIAHLIARRHRHTATNGGRPTDPPSERHGQRDRDEPPPAH